jgi:hypothetical protein
MNEVYSQRGIRRLMVAVINEAVDELNFRVAHTSLAQAMEAAYWLIGTAPDWFEVLDVPMPMAAYHDWIDRQVAKWEELFS